MAKQKYTVGLDIGTNSVGWAVINQDFKLVSGKKHINDNGKQKRSRTNLWGVRLFDAAETAEDRRLKRGMRRRIARRKERLNYLRGIFQADILAFDDSFFIRMDESFLQDDDKQATAFSYRDQSGAMQTRVVTEKEAVKYPLFNGKSGSGETYTDESAYYNQYPTIYHLRQRLIDNPAQADLRLVYLAMHHILKYRGHFVNQGQTFDLGNINIAGNLTSALDKLDEASSFKFGLADVDADQANAILKNKQWSASKKAYELNALFEIIQDTVYRRENETQAVTYDSLTVKQQEKWLAEKQKQVKAFLTGIVGNTISPKDIFANKDYDKKQNEDFPEKIKYSNENFEEQIGALEKYLDETEVAAIVAGKDVYESLVLSNILTKSTLSGSMIEKYNVHGAQLKSLKSFSRKVSAEFYDKLFNVVKDEKGKPHIGVYAQYVDGVGNPAKRLAREDFYDALKKVFESEFKGLTFPVGEKGIDFTKTDLSADRVAFIREMNEAINLENYLPKQRQADNGEIPYQVHEHELIRIIENQKQYYPFLGDKVQVAYEDESGQTQVRSEYKIQVLFKFRIPYYVGTLAKNSGWVNEDGKKLVARNVAAKNSWVVRNSDERVTPWNFEQVINKEASSINFIERMTNFDTYLPNEKLLPKNSLLYQEFIVNNELISSGYYLNGRKEYFLPEQRQRIITRLFKRYRKVSAKQMLDFLKNEYQIKLDDDPKKLFGLDTFVKVPSYNGSLSTVVDLTKKMGISEDLIANYPERFEEIIKWQTIFEDKKILKKTIREVNHNKWSGMLTAEQVNKLSKRHYTGWGRLSQKLLDGVKTSQGRTIIESLREGICDNFMRLIEDEKIAEFIANAQVAGAKDGVLAYDLVDQLPGSPAIKKGIWQSLRVLQELEHYLGRDAIGKVVIEMSRDDESSRRTKARKQQLEEFYKKFKESTGSDVTAELKRELSEKDAKEIDDEKVFLYFLQNGKSMYSGDQLYLSRLADYQVDHIVPQTYIKDDSLDNKVLVTQRDNQNKGGDTPSQTVVTQMNSYWEMLAKNGQVSPRKLANLKKGPITLKQREGFINRQLVENRQITKHVANILMNYYTGTDTLVLTPKSGLTSQLRSGLIYELNPAFDEAKALDRGKAYQVERYTTVKLHDRFVKNRKLNDYHHAHDAYLNAFVAQYVYQEHPEWKNAWVYGKYPRNGQADFGKWATQRKQKSLQLLSSMANDVWNLEDPDTMEKTILNRDETFEQMRQTLCYRNINIVKKLETQTGKFGDESVYKKGNKADHYSLGLKRKYPPQKYGGTKGAISAVTALVKDNSGRVIPVSISASDYDSYQNASDKLAWLLMRKKNIAEILVASLPKYTKYELPSGALRLLASYQEAQSAVELPMLNLGLMDDEAKVLNLYDQLAQFIADNKLFTDKKIALLKGEMRAAFDRLEEFKDKQKVIDELLGVTNGSNQGLQALNSIGLGTSNQRLKSGNTMTNGVTLINESVTGLYLTRTTYN